MFLWDYKSAIIGFVQGCKNTIFIELRKTQLFYFMKIFQ